MNIFKLSILCTLFLHATSFASNTWHFVINGSPVMCSDQGVEQFWLCQGERYNGLIYHAPCGSPVNFSPMLMSEEGLELELNFEHWSDASGNDLLSNNTLQFSYRDYFDFKAVTVRQELSKLLLKKNAEAIIKNGIKFTEALRHFFSDLKTLAFEQRIRFENKILFSDFHLLNPRTNKQNNVARPCVEAETLSSSAARFTLQKITAQPGREPGLLEAQELFKKISARSDIAFAYSEDGCFARAHIIAAELFKQGFHTGKIWLAGDLKDPTRPGEEWSFHVAPLIYVYDEESSSTIAYVIDPTLDPHNLLSIEQWLIKAGIHNQPPIISYPIPEESEFFETIVLAFSSHIPLYPFEYDSLVPLADTLREAYKENKDNLKTIKSKKNNYY